MSTVDDAVEAGARALSESEYGEGPHDPRLAALAVAAAWPILSAPLRELHPPLDIGVFIGCHNCPDACPVAQYIIETDKELGL